MPDPQHTARKARDLVSQARKLVPTFGLQPLTDAQLSTLLDAVSIRVSDWDEPERSMFMPVPRGPRRLFVQRDLHPRAKQWIALVEVGRHLAGDAEDARAQAEAFATTGALVPSGAEGIAGRDCLRSSMGERWFWNRFVPLLLPAGQLAAGDVCDTCRTAEEALELGRAARRASHYEEAEACLLKAVELGTRAASWTAVADAQICLGIVARQKGNIPEARRRLVVATVTVECRGVDELRGNVHHEQFATLYPVGEFARGLHHARQALRGYGAGHPRLLYLAGDVAACFMLQGRASLALPVLRAMVPHVTDARLQTVHFANIGRAAGTVGDRDAFAHAWDRALVAIGRQGCSDGVAQAFLDLAHGAAQLDGESERAMFAAHQALELATERRERRVAVEAEALLEEMRTGRPFEEERPADLDGYLDAEALATDLVSAFEDAVPAGA